MEQNRPPGPGSTPEPTRGYAGAGYAFDSFVAVFTEASPFAVSNVTFLGEFLLGW